MTLLAPELERYLDREAMYPMIRHPLVYSIYFENSIEVKRLNEQLKQKTKLADKARSEKQWSQYVFLHERPWRTHAFFEVREEMMDAAYWDLLGQIWIDSENIFQERVQWWELLTSPRLHREKFSDTPMREALAKQPDPVPIYRGTTSIEETGSYLGYSWTLDKSKAAWFATRFMRDEEEFGHPVVVSGTVEKKCIIGFFGNRNEAEVVVMPADIQNIQWEKTNGVQPTDPSSVREGSD